MAHWEIIGTLIYKLIDGLCPEELKKAGLDPHYIQHGHDVYPHDAAGVSWTAAYIQVIEDPITNLSEDMGTEQYNISLFLFSQHFIKKLKELVISDK